MLALIKLATVGALTVAVTICMHLLDSRCEAFRKLPYMTRQIMIGCAFGALAVFGTEFGIPFEGGTLNIRDSAPICASLVFGGPAGITAALIGAVERWLAVLWGAGASTRLAGCCGIMFAGLFSAFVRKFLMENRRSSAIYAVAVGCVCEVFHLFMVFTTNMENYEYVLEVVISSAPYMISLVSLTAGAALFIVNHISRDSVKIKKMKEGIAQKIGLALIVTIVIACLVMIGFVVTYQDSIAKQNAKMTIETTLNDVAKDIDYIEKYSDDPEQAIETATRNRRIGTNGIIIIYSNDLQPIADSASDIEDQTYDISTEHAREYSKYINSIEEGDLGKWTSVNGIDFYSMVKRTDDCIIMGFYPVEEANVIKWSSVYLTAFSIIIILTAIFVQIFFLIRSIVIKNIREINSKLAKIASGDLDTVVEAGGSEEFVSLSEDINTTVDTLKHYIQEAETRMDKDLQLAKNIQESALSKEYPESNRFELYANMKAAKEVGGDFYDFYKIDEDRVAFLVADVSGKGIPAALFMMRSKTLIKSLVDSGADVATVLTKANEELCKNNEAEMFVTAWLGILDLNTNIVSFANAGHNRPVIVSNEGKAEYIQGKSGFVLAGMEGIIYKSEEIQMQKGDSLFLYTDGVTEAVNEKEDLYSDEKLLDELEETQDMRPHYMCRYIKNSIDAFAGEAPQFDDITMLAIRLKDEDDVDREKVVVPNKESIAEVEDYFEHRWDQLELSNFIAMKTNIIIDEVYSHIVHFSGASMAKISMIREGKNIIMKFTDNGIESNPLEAVEQNMSVPAEERNMDSLGLFMVKEMAESMTYERIDGKNIITVVMNADAEAEKTGK